MSNWMLGRLIFAGFVTGEAVGTMFVRDIAWMGVVRWMKVRSRSKCSTRIASCVWFYGALSAFLCNSDRSPGLANVLAF